MSKPAFSIADLQGAQKKLSHNEVAESKAPTALDVKPMFSHDELQPLEDLYSRFDGDLDLIFGELGADPTKAKKPHHRPKGAKDFAQNHLLGYYSVEKGSADDHAAEAKMIAHK